MDSLHNMPFPSLGTEREASNSWPKGLSRVILAAAWIICVFYPFKGLPGAALYFLAGIDNFSDVFIPLVAGFSLLIVLANFVLRGRFTNKRESLFCALGLILISFALVRMKLYYAKIVFMFFLLPFLLYPMMSAPGRFVYRLIRSMFFLVALYAAGEHILFHTHLYGITDNILVTESGIVNYYSQLAYKLESTDGASHNYVDWRMSPGGRLRTGGFLGQPYQMGALINLAALFFYVVMRRRFSWRNLFCFVLAAFGLLNCMSTTAVVSFGLSALFYEVYFNRGVKRLILPILCICAALWIFRTSAPISFLYQRVASRDPGVFFAPFLPNKYGHLGEFSPRQLVARSIVGWQGWLPGEGNLFFAENDFVTIVACFGVFISLFLFRRWVWPVFAAKKIGRDDLIIYSMVTFDAVLSLMHNDTITSPNVFILFTLLNLMSYRIIKMHSVSGNSEQILRSNRL